jgi:hypothetical protein
METGMNDYDRYLPGLFVRPTHPLTHTHTN